MLLLFNFIQVTGEIPSHELLEDKSVAYMREMGFQLPNPYSLLGCLYKEDHSRRGSDKTPHPLYADRKLIGMSTTISTGCLFHS
jgi:hypothetical protein